MSQENVEVADAFYSAWARDDHHGLTRLLGRLARAARSRDGPLPRERSSD
jgi:hypothetical protein